MVDDSKRDVTPTGRQQPVSRRQLLATAGALICLPVIPRLAMASTVLAVRTWPAAEYTRVTLELDSELKAEHFTLDNPHRMVVDIDGLRMSDALQKLVANVKADDPYIQSLRVGQNRPNVVRIVIDLKQAIAPQVFTLKPIGDYQYRLVLDLYPLVAQDPLMAFLKQQPDLSGDDPLARILEEIGQGNPAGLPSPAVPPSIASPAKPEREAPAMAERKRRQRTVTIAIDAGHGGEDPGAIGKGGTYEKDVVLAIAKRLKAKIDATPGMRGYLTRDGDYFVPLRVRVEKARRVKADLFVSIHADAFVRPTAGGSSVFVLSDRGATSTTASWLAKKENAADLIGGVNLGAQNQDVAKLLLDLSTTAQIKDSKQVAQKLLNELRDVYRLHKPQVEQAGFAVLRAPDIPSVLVETAFISNPKEERLLRNAQYQDKFATALHRGVTQFFRSNPHLAEAS
ncbi:MAG: N-acetylmuramoyl-L-alanine amidase [Burkholderiaceae bacterium]|nr:N-acetylmuramoyl-L-alanine amidase [Burkholderiaceae bacterium]MCD8517104.1 N-acetylmuramoyl-L-alanine amidase [Burkholderiaceae bacterium]MCD8565538.1 N-acetylmuramoyl-L-alanine amidase [Burkholderiaceae bacterium]